MSDLLGENDLNAGEQIPQRVLQGERDCEPSDSCRGDQRRDVDSKVLEDDEHTQDADREPCEVHDQRGGADRTARLPGQHLDGAACKSHSSDDDRADHNNSQPAHSRAQEQRIDPAHVQREVDPT